MTSKQYHILCVPYTVCTLYCVYLILCVPYIRFLYNAIYFSLEYVNLKPLSIKPIVSFERNRVGCFKHDHHVPFKRYYLNIYNSRDNVIFTGCTKYHQRFCYWRFICPTPTVHVNKKHLTFNNLELSTHIG